MPNDCCVRLEARGSFDYPGCSARRTLGPASFIGRMLVQSTRPGAHMCPMCPHVPTKGQRPRSRDPHASMLLCRMLTYLKTPQRCLSHVVPKASWLCINHMPGWWHACILSLQGHHCPAYLHWPHIWWEYKDTPPVAAVGSCDDSLGLCPTAYYPHGLLMILLNTCMFAFTCIPLLAMKLQASTVMS